ncbi:hypothetical protein THAOC_15104 [Thalassiosira oceanica]|uniref:Uncharacterized protein n=1 Tax=Thalassiosira oceanica TaxID=159749 RepID=K0T1B8_THAOC|nr:hypothetical protein THAOC_15104 [Thalassiosira oceanica]|eukprot:EJK64187.1 hypothetical protein THAOC_15104 [Thalassiosira oceanica]
MCQINQHRRQTCFTLAKARPIHHCSSREPSVNACSAGQITSASVFICTHALLDSWRPAKPSKVRCSERQTKRLESLLMMIVSITYTLSPGRFPEAACIGMHARAREIGLPSINIDPNELVDAQWFDKEVIYQATVETDRLGAVMDPKVVEDQKAKGLWGGKLLVPAKGVLARTLIDKWLK